MINRINNFIDDLVHSWRYPAAVFFITALIGLFYTTAIIEKVGDAEFPLDDAWIHFTFARNLALNHEMSFSPGHPSTGSSAPLWTIILSVFFALGIKSTTTIVLLTNLLSIGFFALAMWVLARWAALQFHAKWIGPATFILSLLDWRLTWGTLSGMEINLLMFLTFSALFAHRKGQWLQMGFWAGLATLCRSEGFILAGVLSMAMLTGPGPWITRFKNIGRSMTVYLIVVMPLYLVYASISGHLLPNTFYAKQVLYRFRQCWRGRGDFFNELADVFIRGHFAVLFHVFAIGSLGLIILGFFDRMRTRRTKAIFMLSFVSISISLLILVALSAQMLLVKNDPQGNLWKFRFGRITDCSSRYDNVKIPGKIVSFFADAGASVDKTGLNRLNFDLGSEGTAKFKIHGQELKIDFRIDGRTIQSDQLRIGKDGLSASSDAMIIRKVELAPGDYVWPYDTIGKPGKTLYEKPSFLVWNDKKDVWHIQSVSGGSSRIFTGSIVAPDVTVRRESRLNIIGFLKRTIVSGHALALYAVIILIAALRMWSSIRRKGELSRNEMILSAVLAVIAAALATVAAPDDWTRVLMQRLNGKIPVNFHGIVVQAGIFAVLLSVTLATIPSFMRIAHVSKRWSLSAHLAPLGWLVFPVAAYTLKMPLLFEYGRYIICLFPLFIAYGLYSVWAGTRIITLDSSSKQSGNWLRFAFVVMCVIVFSSSFRQGMKGNYVQRTTGLHNLDVAAGKWVARNTKADAVVAGIDIGCIGYFGNRTTFDLCGLVTPEVVPVIHQHNAMLHLMKRSGVTHVLSFSDWFREFEHNRDLVTVYRLRSSAREYLMFYRTRWSTGKEQ